MFCDPHSFHSWAKPYHPQNSTHYFKVFCLTSICSVKCKSLQILSANLWTFSVWELRGCLKKISKDIFSEVHKRYTYYSFLNEHYLNYPKNARQTAKHPITAVYTTISTALVINHNQKSNIFKRISRAQVAFVLLC